MRIHKAPLRAYYCEFYLNIFWRLCLTKDSILLPCLYAPARF